MQKIRSQAVNGHHRAAPDAGDHLKQSQKNETAQQQEIGQHGTADGKPTAAHRLQINQEDEGVANDKQRSGKRWEDPFPQRPFSDQESEIKPNQSPQSSQLFFSAVESCPKPCNKPKLIGVRRFGFGTTGTPTDAGIETSQKALPYLPLELDARWQQIGAGIGPKNAALLSVSRPDS
jgi:hypothetical protein